MSTASDGLSEIPTVIPESVSPSFGTPPAKQSADAQFLLLTKRIVAHLFNGKGYMEEEYWEKSVNYSDIRDQCFYVTKLELDSKSNVECILHRADKCLAEFLRRENIYYFHIYIGLASFLILLAMLFNAIAIVAVSRCREKYPRHHVFISLSLSDLILTMTLLFKRCGDEQRCGNEDVSDFLRNNVAVLFQIGYIMSALGLLCLSLDNVLAITAPFFYESLSRPLLVRVLIVCLWTLATTTAIVIRLCNLQDSDAVQMVVCVSMLVLLLMILASYIFTCLQSHLHRRRLAVMTDDRRLIDIRNQLRGFLTTGILVFWCLICWSPLVGYLLTDEDQKAKNHGYYARYLVVALLVLHLNSVIDPIIYCLRLRDIRKSLFQLLGINQKRSMRSQSIMLRASSPCSSVRNRLSTQKSLPSKLAGHSKQSTLLNKSDCALPPIDDDDDFTEGLSLAITTNSNGDANGIKTQAGFDRTKTNGQLQPGD